MVLVVSKREYAQTLHVSIGSNGRRRSTSAGGAGAGEDGKGGRCSDSTVMLVLEGVGQEPGFAPPTERGANADGAFTLGPYAVALFHIRE